MPIPRARPSSLLTTLAAVVALAAGCQAGPAAEPPAALTLTGPWPTTGGATALRAEAEAREGPVFHALAEDLPSGPGFELTLPATVPATVTRADPAVPALLCAGASSVQLDVTRSPLTWLELDALWLEEGPFLRPLRSTSRPGIALGATSGFEDGDRIDHWLHVARSTSITGGCTFGFGGLVVQRGFALDLVAGWNALRTVIEATTTGGVPTALATTVLDDGASANDWHVGDPLYGATELVRVPGSRQHANATWWGYQQTKIVRDGEEVWISVIDNDVADGDPLVLRVLQRDPSAPTGWAERGTLPSTRPGPLLLHAGAVYAFAHAQDIGFDYDTVGPVVSLRPATGDAIVRATKANIRYGITVDAGGVGWLAWGGVPPEQPVGLERDFELFRGPIDDFVPSSPSSRWQPAARLELDAAFHYPYLVADADRLLIAAVENQNVGNPTSNRYRRVLTWRVDPNDPALHDDGPLLDLPAAADDWPDRLRLVDVSDLYLDAGGVGHLLILLFANVDPQRGTLHHYTLAAGPTATWTLQPHPLPSCTWARLVALPGIADPALACTTFDGLHVATLDGGASVAVRLPPSLLGAYPYVTAPRSGSDGASADLDVLLVSGNAITYPDGPAFLLTMDRAQLAALLLD
jgi:hypothetical protein